MVLLNIPEIPEWPDQTLTEWDNSLNPETRSYKRMVDLTEDGKFKYRNEANVTMITTADKREEIRCRVDKRISYI